MSKRTSWLIGLLLLTLACSRTDAAPHDLESGKAPTGTIDPGPDAPSRVRAASMALAGAGGGGGVSGMAGGGMAGGGMAGSGMAVGGASAGTGGR
jgi:hypothetical protein